MSHDFDPEGRRLPIKLDSTSNGEFVPVPLREHEKRANALASEKAGALAKKLGLGRRQFLVSARGAASTLLAFNAASALAGCSGGFFDVDEEAATDAQLAEAELGKKEWIFDVQGHFVNPEGAWLKDVPAGASSSSRRAAPLRPCSPSTPRMPWPAAAAASSTSRRRRRPTRSSHRTSSERPSGSSTCKAIS